MKIVPLSPEYDRSLFDCGEPELLDDPLHLFLPLRTAKKLV
jgi:hypothetical protein